MRYRSTFIVKIPLEKSGITLATIRGAPPDPSLWNAPAHDSETHPEPSSRDLDPEYSETVQKLIALAATANSVVPRWSNGRESTRVQWDVSSIDAGIWSQVWELCDITGVGPLAILEGRNTNLWRNTFWIGSGWELMRSALGPVAMIKQVRLHLLGCSLRAIGSPRDVLHPRQRIAQRALTRSIEDALAATLNDAPAPVLQVYYGLIRSCAADMRTCGRIKQALPGSSLKRAVLLDEQKFINYRADVAAAAASPVLTESTWLALAARLPRLVERKEICVLERVATARAGEIYHRDLPYLKPTRLTGVWACVMSTKKLQWNLPAAPSQTRQYSDSSRSCPHPLPADTGWSVRSMRRCLRSG